MEYNIQQELWVRSVAGDAEACICKHSCGPLSMRPQTYRFPPESGLQARKRLK